jgi:hypothetical protein
MLLDCPPAKQVTCHNGYVFVLFESGDIGIWHDNKAVSCDYLSSTMMHQENPIKWIVRGFNETFVLYENGELWCWMDTDAREEELPPKWSSCIYATTELDKRGAVVQFVYNARYSIFLFENGTIKTHFEEENNMRFSAPADLPKVMGNSSSSSSYVLK